MNITNEDLEDYEEKFRSLFLKQNRKKINEDDMLCLIDNLTKELELSRKYETTLQKNFKLCLENDDVNITTKYVTLQEKFDNNEKENVELKHQLNNLQIQVETDKKTQQNEYLNKISELEENHRREIINLKNQMESDKICYETKEKELYNELQLAQASTALQCDEIESNLKRQLVDASSRLRQSQNQIRSLQLDISNLRNQLTSQQYTPSYQKLEKPVLKYQPLPLTRGHKISEQIEDIEHVEAPIRHSSHSITPLIFKGTNLPKGKHILPPLKQCSDVGTKKNKNTQKKRKLYNPEEIEYLEELEESNK